MKPVVSSGLTEGSQTPPCQRNVRTDKLPGPCSQIIHRCGHRDRAYPGITGLEGAGRASGRGRPFSRLCACPGRPAGPMGHRPGRRMARRFRDAEITAEHPAVAEHPGNWGCPKFPRKPDVPRKWEQRDWCAAWDRIWPAARARGAHPLRGTAPAAPDRARPAGLPVYGTRSTGHDLAGRTAIDPGPSVSVARRDGDFSGHRAYIRSLQALRSMITDSHAHDSSAGGHCGSCAQ
jgi:hypothetical protein